LAVHAPSPSTVDTNVLQEKIQFPIGVRLILLISNTLDLELDHLDIKTAYLNAELPEKERFY
jgi:hypothetical protein